MKPLSIEVSERKYEFVVELLKNFTFVKVNNKKKTLTKEQLEFTLAIKSAFEEMQLHQKGKLKLKKAEDFLNEL